MENTISKIALDLIDDPQIAMRTELDDAEMQELMADLKLHGLLEPIVLNKKGNRFEVIAGHRRTRAARLLGWAVIDAIVKDVSDDVAFAMRLSENLQRKDVDPVDEACYIGEIILRTKKTPSEIADMLHRSIEWVKDRLEVFAMPDYLKAPLKQKKFALGTALELAQITNENTRYYYVNYASLNGCNVATAKRWRIVVNAQQEASGASPTLDPNKIAEAPAQKVFVTCAQCGKPAILEETICVNVHKNSCPIDAPAVS